MPIVMLECTECKAITMDQLITEEEHELALSGRPIPKDCTSNQCRGKVTDHVLVGAEEERKGRSSC